MTGAEAMVRTLEAHGVRHIFGLCGDTTLPFYDALYRLDHGLEHVLTRDERCASYMADGHARVSRRGGVCGPTLVDVISPPPNEAKAPVSEWIA